jgi:hypothetical protein
MLIPTAKRTPTSTTSTKRFGLSVERIHERIHERID